MNILGGWNSQAEEVQRHLCMLVTEDVKYERRGCRGEAQKEADDWLWPPQNRTQTADNFINPTGGNGFEQLAKLHTDTQAHDKIGK